jgi:hypothetical protein
MQAEKSCDYNNHDHYADDVKYIHFLAPIEETLALGQQRWRVLVPIKSFSTVARSRPQTRGSTPVGLCGVGHRHDTRCCARIKRPCFKEALCPIRTIRESMR